MEVALPNPGNAALVDDLDIELLTALPAQGVEQELAGLDVAAGEIPDVRVPRQIGAPVAEQHPTGLDEDGGDHVVRRSAFSHAILARATRCSKAGTAPRWTGVALFHIMRARAVRCSTKVTIVSSVPTRRTSTSAGIPIQESACSSTWSGCSSRIRQPTMRSADGSAQTQPQQPPDQLELEPFTANDPLEHRPGPLLRTARVVRVDLGDEGVVIVHPAQRREVAYGLRRVGLVRSGDVNAHPGLHLYGCVR